VCVCVRERDREIKRERERFCVREYGTCLCMHMQTNNAHTNTYTHTHTHTCIDTCMTVCIYRSVKLITGFVFRDHMQQRCQQRCINMYPSMTLHIPELKTCICVCLHVRLFSAMVSDYACSETNTRIAEIVQARYDHHKSTISQSE